uniref:Acetyl-coenzyme A carboxylase carboxyl transferase subunit beta, chloroplastic n=1 Tax=Phanera erythropoda TaxID=3078827 RepID=A0AAT9ZSW0_9FABA
MIKKNDSGSSRTESSNTESSKISLRRKKMIKKNDNGLSRTESSNTESSNTESSNTESSNTESSKISLRRKKMIKKNDSGLSRTESSNTESSNTESSNTESSNTESSNTESSNTESSNTESSNTESSKISLRRKKMIEKNDSGLSRTESSNTESSNVVNENVVNENVVNETAIIDTKKYKHLWVRCEKCYGLNYVQILKSQMNICEFCGYHLKMTSLERIELLIDPGTWNPMDEDMVSLDPIEWDSSESDSVESGLLEFDPEFDWGESDSEEFNWEEFDPNEFDPSDFDPNEFDPNEFDSGEFDSDEFDSNGEESYKDRIDSYQKASGLTEAVQTGTGELNGLPVAIGVMDFHFLGGSMGSVVGEKITRLIEYAKNHSLPLILVCASGGARMQEGSLSLMQMAKIASALYDYQVTESLFYISVLTSPTTGGVTASFGMLGDIIIAEPQAYVAFAGKRVIEETLKTTVPEGSQESENLKRKGTCDFIVPRQFLKMTLDMIFKMHYFCNLRKRHFRNLRKRYFHNLRNRK